MGYSAKSSRDMHALSRRLAWASTEHHIFLAASIAGHGMMLPQLWVRAAVAFGSWRSKQPKSIVWASLMTRYPEIASQTIDATVTWIATGTDADGEGIGGFNQREVDQLVRLLNMTEQPQ